MKCLPYRLLAISLSYSAPTMGRAKWVAAKNKTKKNSLLFFEQKASVQVTMCRLQYVVMFNQVKHSNQNVSGTVSNRSFALTWLLIAIDIMEGHFNLMTSPSKVIQFRSFHITKPRQCYEYLGMGTRKQCSGASSSK